MTHASPDDFILHGPAATAFTSQRLGKLTPVFVPEGEPAPFTRLDTFDQTLRRSGRLLLDLGTALDLIRPDSSAMTQATHGRTKFVPDIAEGPVKQALSDLSPLRSLLPCGTGKLSRAGLAFEDDDHKVHCRAALQILTGAEGQTVILVMLHPLRGYARAQADLRHALATNGMAFDMDALHGLLFPASPAPAPKPKLALTADQTAHDAATAIIALQIPVARLSEPGIVADHDTEFLHDYRVALRRIRSVLSLFRGVYPPDQTATLKARFSALMAQTGMLRDLDVHLLEKPSYYDLLPEIQHPGLDTMFALRAADRAKALARLSRHLRSKAHGQEMTELARLFATPQALPPGPKADTPAYPYACALIWKRYRKIRQIAANLGPATPDTDVHTLRIHCKKLRYLMEFFAGLFPPASVKSLLKPLKALQDHLGLVNDLSVQQVSLQSFLQGSGAWPDSTKLQVAQTVGALTTVLHQRKLDERRKTMDALSGFISPETQKTFREVFHPSKPGPPRKPNP